MACLRDHCIDCIKRSMAIEYNKHYQVASTIEATKPTCFGCGRTSIWKGIEYKEAFLRRQLEEANVNKSMFDQVVNTVLEVFPTKSLSDS